MISLKETTLSSAYQTSSKTEKAVKYKGKIWTVIKNKSNKLQSLEKAALKAVKEFNSNYQTSIGLTISDVLRLIKKIRFFPNE